MVNSFDRQPWSELATTAPTLPGGAGQQVEVLLEVLRSFDGIQESVLTNTPEATDQILKQIGSLSLTQRSPSGAALTDLGRQWLADPNGDDLFRIMHARLAYFGEALALIAKGPTTVEDLSLDATSQYSISWKSLDQVRRRLAWFQALGLVEGWQDRKYRITECGEAVLDTIQVKAPEDVRAEFATATEGADLPSAPPLMQRALSQLDPSSRRLTSWPYLTSEPVEALSLIAEIGLLGTTKEAAVEALRVRFKIARSSAKTTVDVAGQLKLYEYSGRDQIKTTSLGREWFENAGPANLVRLLHLHLLAVGEILLQLDDTPRTVGEIHAHLFKELSNAPSQTRTASCIKILTTAGAVTQLGHSRHVITATGRTLADTLPMTEVAEVQGGSPELRAHQVEIGEEIVEAIANELIEASRDSSNPERFEKAAAAAFTALNVEARHLGGPGRTDVLVTVESNLNVLAKAIVDAKSTASQLNETSIKFEALREHAQKHNASHMAVVAPNFEGSGRLADWARENKVVLFTASELADILRSDRRLPFSAVDVAALLTIGGRAEVETRRTAEMNWLNRLTRVVGELAAESSQDQPEPIAARDIGRVLRREGTGIGDSDVASILQFLGLPEISAVLEHSNGTFTLPSSPKVAANRLRTIANAIEQASKN